MSAPRTWITGELVTASMLNEFVRDHFDALKKKGIAIGIGDFAGAPITTGIRAVLEVPFGVVLTGFTLLTDAAGSLALDVLRCAYADYDPPTHPASGDSIAGSEKPTVVADDHAQDLSLTTWDTDIEEGDIIAVKVDSTSGVIKQATLTLRGVAIELT
jgi:hypothetical protein